MCGVLFTTSEDIAKEKFASALDIMRHRGPDAPLCYFEHENIKMGHNRLKIIDINERSNQPYYSKNKQYIIIYNGEVYNYQELAKQFNIQLATNCDTELILELSIKIGFKNAIRLLNGMFTYIIYDKISRNFFVARDRLGVKPLYWYYDGKNYIFASEISAICLLLQKTEIDEIGLRQYRKLRTFFNGHTIYKQIHMFPAASYFENRKIESYWSLPMCEQTPPDDDELRELITSAVKLRQISDVPVGSYLSGGLDSTIVTAISKETHTWTIGIPNNNEFEYARLAADELNTQHHEIMFYDNDFIPTAVKMIKQRHEPLSVPNEVLLYALTCKVKSYNKVILSGEGADELFFGYDRIFRWANNALRFDIREFSKLYSYGNNDDIEIVDSVVEPFYKYGNPINIVAAFFQLAHLHGLLRRLDNATMACSVEARVPFTDYRLVERLFGCPYEWKTHNGTIKAPLKRIFMDVIPEPIIKRKKVGFPVPLLSYDSWLKLNLRVLDIEQ